jgi:hypothetical protein
MYIYHNENPQNWHVPDCVIRAITLALNIGYYEVVKMLDKNAQELSCECLNVRCYEKLLDEDLCFPHFVSEGRTAEEVANDFPNDTLLLRMEGHLSVSVNGIIYDIFNCSSEEITDFWVVI